MALRADTRRVAEATPAALTASYLFEAAVSLSNAGGGEGASAAREPPASTASKGMDDGDALPSSSSRRRSRRRLPPLPPSTAALSHSLALAAGKLSRSSGAPLPRGASHVLCRRCGRVLGGGGSEKNDVVDVKALSRSYRRRCQRRQERRRRRGAAPVVPAAAGASSPPSPPSRRRSGGGEAPQAPTNTAALVVECGGCEEVKVRSFYTRELAEAAAAALRRGGGG